MEDRPDYITDAMQMIGADTPRRIVTEVSGFTPIFDAIVQDYHDETIAAVFGAIWRYCQMQDGVCRASLGTIADVIGVDKATVMRHAQILCEDGYLKDLTPDLRNRPHIYAETGRIQMRSKFETVAQRNTTVAERNATVAQSKLSKDLKKDIKKERTTTTTAAPKKSNAFALYESNIGPLTPIISDTLKDMEQTYTEAWVLRAIQEAATSNVRNLKYIGGILAGYKERGSPDIGRTKISNTRPSAPKKETTEEILRRMAVDAYNRR